MKSKLQLTISLFLAAATSIAPATAQSSRAGGHSTAQPEFALTYTYIRSNAHPLDCGCFTLNGGTASLAWPVRVGGFALEGSVTDTTARNVSNSGGSLNLSLFAGGIHYRPLIGHGRWQPFGQALVGVAHASGGLVQGQYSVTKNARAALAANIGGGLDLRVLQRYSLRLIQADYLLTTFNNSANDRQNSLNLSAGIVFRFGR